MSERHILLNTRSACASRPILEIFSAALAAIICLLLTGCAVQPSAPSPIQIQTRTVEVKVPTPVPCFKEEDRPIMPTPTPINMQTATIDQMAAAIDADALADSIYTAAVDRLFLQCQKAGGTP